MRIKQAGSVESITSRLWYFLEKSFSREDCAEDFLVCVVRRNLRHTEYWSNSSL